MSYNKSNIGEFTALPQARQETNSFKILEAFIEEVPALDFKRVGVNTILSKEMATITSAEYADVSSINGQIGLAKTTSLRSIVASQPVDFEIEPTPSGTYYDIYSMLTARFVGINSMNSGDVSTNIWNDITHGYSGITPVTCNVRLRGVSGKKLIIPVLPHVGNVSAFFMHLKSLFTPGNRYKPSYCISLNYPLLISNIYSPPYDTPTLIEPAEAEEGDGKLTGSANIMARSKSTGSDSYYYRVINFSHADCGKRKAAYSEGDNRINGFESTAIEHEDISYFEYTFPNNSIYDIEILFATIPITEYSRDDVRTTETLQIGGHQAFVVYPLTVSVNSTPLVKQSNGIFAFGYKPINGSYLYDSTDIKKTSGSRKVIFDDDIVNIHLIKSTHSSYTNISFGISTDDRIHVPLNFPTCLDAYDDATLLSCKRISIEASNRAHEYLMYCKLRIRGTSTYHYKYISVSGNKYINILPSVYGEFSSTLQNSLHVSVAVMSDAMDNFNSSTILERTSSANADEELRGHDYIPGKKNERTRLNDFADAFIGEPITLDETLSSYFQFASSGSYALTQRNKVITKTSTYVGTEGYIVNEASQQISHSYGRYKPYFFTQCVSNAHAERIGGASEYLPAVVVPIIMPVPVQVKPDNQTTRFYAVQPVVYTPGTDEETFNHLATRILDYVDPAPNQYYYRMSMIGLESNHRMAKLYECDKHLNRFCVNQLVWNPDHPLNWESNIVTDWSNIYHTCCLVSETATKIYNTRAFCGTLVLSQTHDMLPSLVPESVMWAQQVIGAEFSISRKQAGIDKFDYREQSIAVNPSGIVAASNLYEMHGTEYTRIPNVPKNQVAYFALSQYLFVSDGMTTTIYVADKDNVMAVASIDGVVQEKPIASASALLFACKDDTKITLYAMSEGSVLPIYEYDASVSRDVQAITSFIAGCGTVLAVRDATSVFIYSIKDANIVLIGTVLSVSSMSINYSPSGNMLVVTSGGNDYLVTSGTTASTYTIESSEYSFRLVEGYRMVLAGMKLCFDPADTGKDLALIVTVNGTEVYNASKTGGVSTEVVIDLPKVLPVGCAKYKLTTNAKLRDVRWIVYPLPLLTETI